MYRLKLNVFLSNYIKYRLTHIHESSNKNIIWQVMDDIKHYLICYFWTQSYQGVQLWFNGSYCGKNSTQNRSREGFEFYTCQINNLWKRTNIDVPLPSSSVRVKPCYDIRNDEIRRGGQSVTRNVTWIDWFDWLIDWHSAGTVGP